jgi:hypothetical protein
VEVYFTNKLTVLSKPVLNQDQVVGAVSTFEPMKSSGLSYVEPRKKTDLRKKAKLPDVQIFIAEEFRGSDSVIISKSNFIQMREYKIDRSVVILSYIGSAAGVITLLILIFGIAAYYRYLTSTVTSTQ